MFTLSDLTNNRNNNLDAIRLIAAFFVLFSHSFPLAGQQEPRVPFYQGNYGELGVNIFFIVSGFLITQSYLRSNDPRKYIWSRVLRIFPALICVILLTGFILGPFVTSLSLKEYFTNILTYKYLLNISLLDFNNLLPGVFDHNFMPFVDGPLWTLAYEFTFYLVIMFLGIVAILKDKPIVLGIFVLSLVLLYCEFNLQFYKYELFWALRFFTYFSIGMVAFLYRSYILLSPTIFLFIMFLFIIASFKLPLNDILFVPMLTYVVLFVGYHPKFSISFLTRFGDFSYGVYIWAWPIQQTIVQAYSKEINPWLLFLMSGSITVVMAALSWHLVEKRTLKLKDYKLPLVFKMKLTKMLKRHP